MEQLERIVYAFWDTLLKMAPWLLFGFLVAGILSLFLTPEDVSKRLGRRAGWRAIVLAVLFGVPLPLCSCGVLPVAVGLRKRGAGKGATAAFLISTPQTGVDSFFATYSLLGWAFAIVRPVVAVITRGDSAVRSMTQENVSAHYAPPFDSSRAARFRRDFLFLARRARAFPPPS